MIIDLNNTNEENLDGSFSEGDVQKEYSFEDVFGGLVDGFSSELIDDDFWNDITGDAEEISESEDLFREAKNAYNKVDDKLLDFIDNFVTNQNEVAKQKKTLKNIFFWFTMISFAFIVLTPIVCLGVLMFADVADYYIIFGSIVSALLEVLTTVIVLPKIVAEYLFNKEEEQANIKIVELMQKYSDTMHGYESN